MNFRGASAWLLGLLLFSFLEPANCRGTSLLHLFQEILDLRRAQNPVICTVKFFVREPFDCINQAYVLGKQLN